MNLLNETDQKALENTINNHKLLVLDNLGKLISRRGEMNVHQWNSFFIWLRKLTRSGLTILIIHHENKTGQHRGTGKMTDDVDLVISIKNPKRKADATSIEVNIEDPRFLYGKACDPFRLAYYISGKREVITDQASTQTPLSLSDENFAFEINTPNLKEREKRILKTIFRLLLLEGRTSFKRSDIMEDEPDAYGESSITKALDKLVQNDLLSKEGDGKGRRYQLTETGRSIYQSKRD